MNKYNTYWLTRLLSIAGAVLAGQTFAVCADLRVVGWGSYTSGFGQIPAYKWLLGGRTTKGKPVSLLDYAE